MREKKNATKVELLKNVLLNDIRSGVYTPGSALPAVRTMMRQYGVSKSTVSQAISNLGALSVLEISHGRATRVRTPEKQKFDILCSGSGGNLFWDDVVEGIRCAVDSDGRYAADRGFASGGWRKSLIRTVFNPSQSRGIFVLGTSDRSFLSGLMEFGVPVLSVCSFTEEIENLPYVAADFTPAVSELAERFKKRGCSRVALLRMGKSGQSVGSLTSGLNYEKFHFARKALLESGVMRDESFAVIDRASASCVEAGYRFLKDLYAKGAPPDGAVLCQDAMAQGFYRAAYELGLSIPGDCSVAGFDDLEQDSYLIPSLTSVNLHRRELGYRAGRMMIDFAENSSRLKIQRIPAELSVRESLF